MMKRSTRSTKTSTPTISTDVNLTSSSTSESPTKMKTRSQVRSNANNLNNSNEIESTNKRDRQRKNQSNSRVPGQFDSFGLSIHHFVFILELVENLINLFRLLGQGLQCLSQYECRQAIELFESIPLKHLQTPWVLSRLANCYYHLQDYQKSSLIYRQLRTKFPYHIDGLEYYSTVLWHLKDDITLAALAHELTDIDRKHSAVSFNN